MPFITAEYLALQTKEQQFLYCLNHLAQRDEQGETYRAAYRTRNHPDIQTQFELYTTVDDGFENVLEEPAYLIFFNIRLVGWSERSWNQNLLAGILEEFRSKLIAICPGLLIDLDQTENQGKISDIRFSVIPNIQSELDWDQFVMHLDQFLCYGVSAELIASMKTSLQNYSGYDVMSLSAATPFIGMLGYLDGPYTGLYTTIGMLADRLRTFNVTSLTPDLIVDFATNVRALHEQARAIPNVSDHYRSIRHAIYGADALFTIASQHQNTAIKDAAKIQALNLYTYIKDLENPPSNFKNYAQHQIELLNRSAARLRSPRT